MRQHCVNGLVVKDVSKTHFVFIFRAHAVLTSGVKHDPGLLESRRRRVLSKRREPLTQRHGVISQKNGILSNTAAITVNLKRL